MLLLNNSFDVEYCGIDELRKLSISHILLKMIEVKSCGGVEGVMLYFLTAKVLWPDLILVIKFSSLSSSSLDDS